MWERTTAVCDPRTAMFDLAVEHDMEHDRDQKVPGFLVRLGCERR